MKELEKIFESKPLEELINEWEDRSKDKFCRNIKEICYLTNQYFEKEYMCNPIESFIWFYAISNDKIKTAKKLESYLEYININIHSPYILSQINKYRSNIKNLASA